MNKILPITLLAFLSFFTQIQAQHSVAREWNELLLQSIREDLARPTVHARNLFHTSAAMYDAWAVFDEVAEPYLLGKTVDGFTCNLENFTMPTDVEAAREEAMSFAVYRLLIHRFGSSRNFAQSILRYNTLMNDLGYNRNDRSVDYSTNFSAAALGNYIAQCYIDYGLQDGSNEQGRYGNLYYTPANPPLVTQQPGNSLVFDPNRWQPLTLDVFIDQSGNVIPFNTPAFLSPEWGNVTPFSMTEDDVTVYERNGDQYRVYKDPGMPPMLGGNQSEEWKWGHQLVSIWSSHLDSNDPTTIDISPASLGNLDISTHPTNFQEYRNFYDLIDGGDPSEGHDINPVTGQPYTPNIVKRADYGRVLAEFWADGPDSETPPGHWFTLLNYVSDHPMMVKKFKGQGEVLGDLEWDVKSYFALGGAMHDCAISAWGIKGWYDYSRPISAIRYMSEKGQASTIGVPSYHPEGFKLVPGYIELVEAGDPLALQNSANIGKVKLYAWRGPDYIGNPATTEAGVGWILAENWWPYQRPTFVTPNFAGYVSGHSTYSRAAADLLTSLTGSAFFPGGMAEFTAEKNEFLVFEEGPSEDIVLQWATYQDASDQTSLSRIWGGIHPPADDLPGRKIGAEIGVSAFNLAESYFYKDEDNDGYLNYVDCDDTNPNVNPGLPETCDGLDNDCNQFVDDGLQVFTYYLDADADGYGDAGVPLDTCLQAAPAGYVTNQTDCRDDMGNINPGTAEICDEIDNNCSGFIDDGIPTYLYFLDFDSDGYGDSNFFVDTCLLAPPPGYCSNDLDCDDLSGDFNPDIAETCDGLDNNCDGRIDEGLTNYVYYVDVDGDNFGNKNIRMDTCQSFAPNGWVENSLDCNDDDANINPDSPEICDDIDNDCNGLDDDAIPYYSYYEDRDGDGFGDSMTMISICYDAPPVGYVTDFSDCDDSSGDRFPGNLEISDNDIDEDCSGVDLYRLTKFFPNPLVSNPLTIRFAQDGFLDYEISDSAGQLVGDGTLEFKAHEATVDLRIAARGIYFFVLKSKSGERLHVERIVVL